MRRGLKFQIERQVAAPDCRQQFFARLDRTLRPAVLLRLEAIHIYRELGRRDDVRQENEFPARKLRAIAQIEIFRQRVMLPTARLFDAGAPPQASSAVEIEKPAAPASRRLFEQKVTVEKHRLDACQQRIGAIQMTPAGLDHPDLWIGEEMDRLL